MAKSNECCKYCIHYDFGYTYTTQIEPKLVCLKQEKKIYLADVSGVKGRVYYRRTNPRFWCNKFEPKPTRKNGRKTM